MTDRVVLASQSPRRKQLLGYLIPEFEIMIPDIEEVCREHESPSDYVRRNAQTKSQVVMEKCAKNQESGVSWLVIGSDTVVAIGDEILEKPKDRPGAKTMLTKLSNATHSVWSGIAITRALSGGEVLRASSTVETRVTFRRLSESEIEDYLDTDEPYDKAGAYAAQGVGSAFVESLNGSYTNVVGLPLTQLHELLQRITSNPAKTNADC